MNSNLFLSEQNIKQLAHTRKGEWEVLTWHALMLTRMEKKVQLK